MKVTKPFGHMEYARLKLIDSMELLARAEEASERKALREQAASYSTIYLALVEACK